MNLRTDFGALVNGVTDIKGERQLEYCKMTKAEFERSVVDLDGSLRSSLRDEYDDAHFYAAQEAHFSDPKTIAESSDLASVQAAQLRDTYNHEDASLWPTDPSSARRSRSNIEFHQRRSE
jgi:hypothetical protein|tara:strand:+ start:27 stop:386 length:360 start_codon:yes stop_codon:yes gene_type:complete